MKWNNFCDFLIYQGIFLISMIDLLLLLKAVLLGYVSVVVVVRMKDHVDHNCL